MSEAQKDTIYIDVDDEITAIIDKLRSSKHKIVALVLPKRATVLQSIVNMRLLKRAATQSKKNLVLITSEAGLLPLAGAVKIHVAKTLQSQPEIPSPPDVPSDNLALDETDELNDEPPEAPDLDKNKSIAELSDDKPAPKGGAHSKALPEDTIELDEAAMAGAAEPLSKAEKKSKKKAEKKLKVPNFERFRLKVILGVAALIILIVGWYLAYFVLPKATVTVQTDNVNVATTVNFTADTTAKSLDATNSIVPAIAKQTTKTDTATIQATGQKNIGTDASGSMTLALTDCSQAEVTIPTGTVVSSNGLSYATQSDVVLLDNTQGPKCINGLHPNDGSSGSTKVIAQSAGDQFNLSARDYAVSGFSNVVGHGSAMSGGTTQNVSIVSQGDVDNATQQLKDKSKAAAVNELKKDLESLQLYPLDDSLTATNPTITPSPAVGAQATNITVTSTTVYSMLGVAQANLKTLVENSAKKQINTSKQAIDDDGLSSASDKATDKSNPAKQLITLQTTVVAGTHIDQDAIKKQIAGKKSGDVQQLLQGYPGVKSVTEHFSPFWVYKTPSKTSRINLVLQKQAQTNASN